jgi:hypothetical protein
MHVYTHTSVSLSVPPSVREAEARSLMLSKEPREKSEKYPKILRTHI